MRSPTIRTTAFATIFVLPLVLPQARHSHESGSMFSASKASADGTFNRLMRWTGYGWSSGYHACNSSDCGIRDALPPVGNTAHQKTPRGSGKFELADPVRPAVHIGGHANHGPYHMPGVHYSHVETFPTSPMPIVGVPMTEIGPSLVAPQAVTPGQMFQPYRSAVPRKSSGKPGVRSEDSGAASPSDLELLPSPKREAEDGDDLSVEGNSFRAVPQRNRSARKPADWQAR